MTMKELTSKDIVDFLKRTVMGPKRLMDPIVVLIHKDDLSELKEELETRSDLSVEVILFPHPCIENRGTAYVITDELARRSLLEYYRMTTSSDSLEG